MNLNVNPGKNSKVDLGARQSAVGMFIAGCSVTTIQQLLKEEDIIVTKRSLYRLINKFMSQLVGFYNL